MSTTELEALAMQASALDGDLAAQSPEAQQAAQELAAVGSLADQNANAVLLILGTAIPMLGEMYPSLNDVYTQEACLRISGSVAPLLAKHNVDLSQLGGKYKEEIAAAGVCLPIGWATYKGIAADIAARQAEAKPQAIGQQATPAQKAALMPGDYGYTESVA